MRTCQKPRLHSRCFTALTEKRLARLCFDCLTATITTQFPGWETSNVPSFLFFFFLRRWEVWSSSSVTREQTRIVFIVVTRVWTAFLWATVHLAHIQCVSVPYMKQWWQSTGSLSTIIYLQLSQSHWTFETMFFEWTLVVLYFNINTSHYPAIYCILYCTLYLIRWHFGVGLSSSKLPRRDILAATVSKLFMRKWFCFFHTFWLPVSDYLDGWLALLSKIYLLIARKHIWIIGINISKIAINGSVNWPNELMS